MLSHTQVWAAIDALAKRHGLTPSGLAKRAGLDPTTFNPSKRIAGDGRPRWPSTESLSKILEATGEPVSRFVAGLDPDAPAPALRPESFSGIPHSTFGVETTAEFDPDGLPAGPNWEPLDLPEPATHTLFALSVEGDALMPVYRHGDIVVISRDTPVRTGDRVVVKPKNSQLTLLCLEQRTRSAYVFKALSGASARMRLAHDEVDWIGRIVWATQ
ncbi:S24 family peptidase [Roseibium aestuarii]|uniref:S24 family peptidase n=1 Tax=Roseibium aestuarii TaxID=2600299 RepID=A0ABW4JTD7_9HYPH|nr:helix-turn-helix transcriptional regulator [Roseibium aestuarii]